MDTALPTVARSITGPRVVLGGGAVAVLLAISHTATDAVAGMFAALLPMLQDRYGLTETGLALLIATLAFSSSLSQPLLGALADRLGRRLVGGLGVILSASLISLIGVAPNVGLLFGLLLVGGLGSGAFHPAGASMARSSGARNVGLAVSLFGAGGTLGLALGPVIGLSFVAVFGLGFTPWLMIPGVLLGLLILALVPPQERTRGESQARLLDARLLTGPVGLLTLTELASSIAVVTFSSALPLWLVSRGLPRDSSVIGWAMAAFAGSAALGGILAAALSSRVNRRLLVSGSMLLAPLPLFAIFNLEPGTPLFFLNVMLAGGLVNAGFPLKVMSAQELAPRSVSTASGLLMGFTTGLAGVLYIGIGRLQEAIGLAPAMSVSYLGLLPGAILAYLVLAERGAGNQREKAVSIALAAPCRCSSGPAGSTASRTDGLEEPGTVDQRACTPASTVVGTPATAA